MLASQLILETQKDTRVSTEQRKQGIDKEKNKQVGSSHMMEFVEAKSRKGKTFIGNRVPVEGRLFNGGSILATGKQTSSQGDFEGCKDVVYDACVHPNEKMIIAVRIICNWWYNAKF